VFFGHNGGTQDDAVRKFLVRGNSTQSADLFAVQTETTTISAFDSVARFKFFDSTGGNSTTFDRTAAGSDHTLTWPNAAASVAGSVLASTTGGVLSWTAASTDGHILRRQSDDTVSFGTVRVDGAAYGGAGEIPYSTGVAALTTLAHPGVANRALRSTSTLPTWAQGDIDFGTFKAIAMACDNGTTLPTSPAPTLGQWFLLNVTGRKVLLQYSGSAWVPVFSLGAITIYVDAASGVNTQNNGTSTGSSAFLTIAYAISQIPALCDGNVTVNCAGSFSESPSIGGKAFTGAYTITFAGVSTVTNSKTVTAIGTGSATTQAYADLNNLTSVAKGDIAVFNDGTTRVVGASGRTALRIDLVGNAIPSSGLTPVQFRPFTTVFTGLFTIAAGQTNIAFSFIKLTNTASYAVLSMGTNITFTQCQIISAGAVDAIRIVSGFALFQTCALMSTANPGSGAACCFLDASAATFYSCLFKGPVEGFWYEVPGTQYGIRAANGSTVSISQGSVVDCLNQGINGSPGSITFYDGTSAVFIKNCIYAVNKELQLSTSGMHSYVQFGLGGMDNQVNAFPYSIETTVSVRVTSVSDAAYTAKSTDDVIAYTGSLTAARTVTLNAGSQYGTGKVLTIKDATLAGTSVQHAGTYNITIDADGAELIDGSGTQAIINNFGFMRIYWDGSAWWKIGGA
jgi:hypothetical protein